MGLKESELTPVSAPLFGFAGPPIHPHGMVRLVMTFGKDSAGRTLMVNYVIVKSSSAYNIILGRPALIDLRAIISPAHISLKFPTGRGSVEVKGDLEVARSCYAATIKGKGITFA